MQQVAFPGIKIVLILSTVETSVIFLHNFGLLVEEFTLFVFVLSLLFIHELATTVITSENPLDAKTSLDFILVLPLYFEHTPVFLQHNRCCVFFITEFLGLIEL